MGFIAGHSPAGAAGFSAVSKDDDCAGSIFDRISAVAMLTIVNVATAD
jgi:hypothetical protein